MTKLTRTELADLRQDLHITQVGLCALCGKPFSTKNPGVVDHDHKTGHVRGLLHRGCNAALGTIENGRARYQLTDPVQFARWARRLATYIHADHSENPIYPTHLSPEEKAEKRKVKARKARALKKAAA